MREQDIFSVDQLRQRWSRPSRQEETMAQAKPQAPPDGPTQDVAQLSGLFARLRAMMASQWQHEEAPFRQVLADKMAAVSETLNQMENDSAINVEQKKALRITMQEQLLSLEDLLEITLLEKKR